MEITELKDIYSKIVDDKSRDVFIKRLLYSITEDEKYTLPLGVAGEIRLKLKKYNEMGKRIVIFGAGKIGKNMIESIFSNIKFECFADNNVKGELCGLKIVDADELKSKYLDSIIVISPLNGNSEIYDQLINLGFSHDNIINATYDLCNCYKAQYFDIFSPMDNKESFVDCGCYDGGTSKLFNEWCNGNYSNIWAFEPDTSNYEICKENLDLPSCQIYNLGAFNEETIVRFEGGMEGQSNISSTGENEIKTIKLDDVLKDEKVTFIKMDIEGAELQALQGAEEIIKRQKPRLAICVYHKPDDIITIPRLILEYNKDYKFMLRHYGIGPSETVLYAF